MTCGCCIDSPHPSPVTAHNAHHSSHHAPATLMNNLYTTRFEIWILVTLFFNMSTNSFFRSKNTNKPSDLFLQLILSNRSFSKYSSLYLMICSLNEPCVIMFKFLVTFPFICSENLNICKNWDLCYSNDGFTRAITINPLHLTFCRLSAGRAWPLHTPLQLSHWLHHHHSHLLSQM